MGLLLVPWTHLSTSMTDHVPDERANEASNKARVISQYVVLTDQQAADVG